MAQPFVEPSHQGDAFNCPLCGAYAHQIWNDLHRYDGNYFHKLPEFSASRCIHCGSWLYWHNARIIVPDVKSAPPANDDLSDDVKADYSEAATIVAKSPRGAAALLRLCIQKLCRNLGESGKDINKDIGVLVKKGWTHEFRKPSTRSG